MGEPTMVVPVEQIHSGDKIVLPQIGDRAVVRVEQYDDVYVVIYVDSSISCWENRAQDKGRWRTVGGSFEKQIRPLHAGELVATRRLVLADDVEGLAS